MEVTYDEYVAWLVVFVSNASVGILLMINSENKFSFKT